MSPRGRLAVVVLATLVATVALHLAGSGALAAPPLASWSGLDAWYGRTGPATAVIALVRLVAFGAGCWLAVTGGLQLVAPAIAVGRFSAVVDGITPRFLQAVSKSAAGLSVTAGLALPTLPSDAVENPPGTAVMVPLDIPAATSSTVPTTTTTPPSTTTVIVAEPAAPPVETVEPTALDDEVVVAPGDSFWSIAVQEAGERALLEYWKDLIEANRDRLVDPSNPDLLYPDQVLRLP